MFKRRLDYLAIPDSSGNVRKERKKRAIEEIHKRGIDKVLILKGKDSEEDILYLGKIVQSGDRVGFDTFPLHFKEYKEIIKKAKRDGNFPAGVKIENVRTGNIFNHFIYGILGFFEEKIKKRRLNYRKQRHERFLQKIKDFVKRII